jgi:ubiquinone/menaquinone biosynthesis C-methylase UbiE
MTKESVLKHWKESQEHWNDDEFLGVTANAFMKLRWKRLNLRCAQELEQRARVLGRNLDMVDVGCAHADFFDFAKGSLRHYSGIEPSKVLLPKNISRGKNFKLLRGKAEDLPLKAASSDFVLLKEVLDHCYDPLAVLKEAYRVLRPGGELLITLTNDHAWYKRLMPAWAERIKANQHDHLNFFYPEWVLRLAQEAGFSGLREESSHYLRLPYKIEEVLGMLPVPLGSAVISLSDAVGTLMAPGYGGSFWIVATK